MTETALELANRVEDRLKSLSAKLTAIDKTIDDDSTAPKLPDTFDADIAEDLTDFKAALKKIRDERQTFYRRICEQSRESNFDAVAELRRLAEVLDGLTSKTAALNAQCEKLDRTRLELKTFSESNTLDETLKTFSEKLSTLGTCDEKIREATDAASTNIDNLKIVLDGQISAAVDLEREFLITCRELADKTKILEQSLKVHSSSDTRFEELHAEITEAVFNDETRTLGAKLAKVKGDRYKLAPEVSKATEPYIEIINGLTKVFMQVRHILTDAKNVSAR